MTEPANPIQTPKGTAADLIAAGLLLFGRQGFAATSTRALAAQAGTNIASIAYHFGSKEGLRRACGEEVARRIGAALSGVTALPATTPEAARAQLELILRRMAVFVTTSRAAEPLLPFMLREVAEAGPVLDAVYSALFEPLHRRLCALWAAATGKEAESARTRIVVFSLIGQVLYFRIGRPIVMRRMGWTGFGADEAEMLAEILVANLHALLDRERLS